MSMSTRVVGFRPPDETWQKMKFIWDSCVALKIDPPDEVDDYFDGMNPDPSGVEVELSQMEWRDDSSAGIEIKVTEIPDHVQTIRFYNSW